MTSASVRAGVRLAALSGLLVLAGCQKTELRPIAPIPLRNPVEIESYGEKMVLHHPYLEGADLVGWRRNSRSDSTLVRVPYEQEIVRLDGKRSFFAGAGGFLVVLTLLLLL
jgi:hypothetical protein